MYNELRNAEPYVFEDKVYFSTIFYKLHTELDAYSVDELLDDRPDFPCIQIVVHKYDKQIPDRVLCERHLYELINDQMMKMLYRTHHRCELFFHRLVDGKLHEQLMLNCN